jgi:23S rRNA (guanosine2251-2'-O)-methyltransferase
MKLGYRERQRRMKETSDQAWMEIQTLPGAMREGYFQRERMPIEIIACPLGKEVNHGGILRVAEAFMLENVMFSYEDDGYNDFSGHRGAIQWQPYEWDAISDALPKRSNRQKVALTLTDEAVSFDNFDYRYPVSLVVGSEAKGVPAEIVNQCDAVVAIPMYGMMGSLNVATATAIVVRHIASLYAQSHGYLPMRPESQRLLNH